MITMILEKQSEVSRGYLCIFAELSSGGKRKTHKKLIGNVPKLPNGFFLRVHYEEETIVDYEVVDSPRNRKISQKMYPNFELFLEKVKKHKFYASEGVLWNELQDIHNPYSIFSFGKADRLHAKLVNRETDKHRLDALVRNAILLLRKERATSFSLDTYITKFREVEQKGSYPYLSVADIVNTISNEQLKFRDGILYDVEYEEAERFVKRNIKERDCVISEFLTKAEIEDFLKTDDMSTEEQKDAVRELAYSNTTVITGGAGVGKTQTINQIIHCFMRNHDSTKLCLVAPTGKASRRMHELTGYEATTIHNRVRINPESDYVYYNEYNPMPYKVYVIDESSMIDMFLMRDLLKAIPLGAKIFFVGDFNQLYPVGPGEPFHDFIRESLCSVVWLTKNFRQGEGLILENANRILDGELIKAGADFNIRLISKHQIMDYASEEIQNISPYNQINQMINEAIMERYADRKHDSYGFYVGEKIITLENTQRYSNGDTGIVTAILSDGIEVLIEKTSVTISDQELKDGKVASAYALTVHKTQGSEYPEINIFIPKKTNDFISKRLMYTAVTRARKKVNLYLYG